MKVDFLGVRQTNSTDLTVPIDGLELSLICELQAGERSAVRTCGTVGLVTL